MILKFPFLPLHLNIQTFVYLSTFHSIPPQQPWSLPADVPPGVASIVVAVSPLTVIRLTVVDVHTLSTLVVILVTHTPGVGIRAVITHSLRAAASIGTLAPTLILLDVDILVVLLLVIVIVLIRITVTLVVVILVVVLVIILVIAVIVPSPRPHLLLVIILILVVVLVVILVIIILPIPLPVVVLILPALMLLVILIRGGGRLPP